MRQRQQQLVPVTVHDLPCFSVPFETSQDPIKETVLEAGGAVKDEAHRAEVAKVADLLKCKTLILKLHMLYVFICCVLYELLKSIEAIGDFL